MLFRDLHHICFVVHDIDASTAYFESIGIGPWREYPPLTDYTGNLDVPNPDAFFAMKYRVVDLGNVQLQLCEPPELDCPQRRFLDSRGRAGVPLYPWYAPGLAEPEELPQILTPSMLIDRARATLPR